MSNLTKDGVAIDVCRHCGSTWLDGGEIAALLAPFTVAAAARLQPGGGGRAADLLDGLSVLEPLLEALVGLLELFGDIFSALG